MKKTINAKPAEWSAAIEAKCDSIEKAEGTIIAANWYTARPYQDEYATGSTKEGFVYTVGGNYPQVWDASWDVSKPDAAYTEPQS